MVSSPYLTMTCCTCVTWSFSQGLIDKIIHMGWGLNCQSSTFSWVESFSVDDNGGALYLHCLTMSNFWNGLLRKKYIIHHMYSKTHYFASSQSLGSAGVYSCCHRAKAPWTSSHFIAESYKDTQRQNYLYLHSNLSIQFPFFDYVRKLKKKHADTCKHHSERLQGQKKEISRLCLDHCYVLNQLRNNNKIITVSPNQTLTDWLTDFHPSKCLLSSKSLCCVCQEYV